MSEREVYDPASKVWTALCAAMVAWIVNWFAVVIPVQRHPRDDPAMVWWFAATLLAAAPSFAWLIGHLMRRDKEGIVMWVVPLALIVCMQLVLLKWSAA